MNPKATYVPPMLLHGIFSPDYHVSFQQCVAYDFWWWVDWLPAQVGGSVGVGGVGVGVGGVGGGGSGGNRGGGSRSP